MTGVQLIGANDSGSSQLVYGVIIALAVIGIVLIVLAVWLIRQTRVDAVVLAPLELMNDRRWRKRDPATQRRLLDEARPTGADPLRPSINEPAVDEEFEQTDRPVQGFEDLSPDAPESPVAPDTVDAADTVDVADNLAETAPDVH